jgi:N-acetylated-alpha-linked acidic dipeptidase
MSRRLRHRRLVGLLASAAVTTGLVAGFGPQTSMASAAPGASDELRAWERALQQEVDADSAAQMSEAMSTYPGLVGTEGAARRAAYSMQKLAEWGLNPKLV